MSLLTKFKNIHKSLKPGLILLVSVFFSCDTSEDPGTEFNLNTNIDVNLAEFELPSSNLFIDSLRTDGENRVLVGNYTDPITGYIQAEGYFQYRFRSGVLPLEDNQPGQDTLRFDSAYLELVPDNIIPFDELAPLSFDVVELRDTLISGVVLLASKQEEISRTIGSFSQEINLSRDSIYRVKLSNDFGQDLFDLTSSVTEDATLSLSTYEFRDLGLVPAGSGTAITDIDIANLETQIKLYMSGDDPDTVYTAFFNVTGTNYTHIERDRTGTEFSDIEEKSSQTLSSGQTVLDPLAGLTTTFSLEPIIEFYENNPNILINAAIVDFVNEDFIARDTIDVFRMYFRRNDGGIFGPAIVQNPFGNIVMNDNGYLSLTSNPAQAIYNRETQKYSTTPTLFFQALYNNYSEEEGLFYIEPISADTIRVNELVLIHPNETILDQAIFQNSGVKLRVFYTEVN